MSLVKCEILNFEQKCDFCDFSLQYTGLPWIRKTFFRFENVKFEFSACFWYPRFLEKNFEIFSHGWPPTPYCVVAPKFLQQSSFIDKYQHFKIRLHLYSPQNFLKLLHIDTKTWLIPKNTDSIVSLYIKFCTRIFGSIQYFIF
jgi:hypothetical protein